MDARLTLLRELSEAPGVPGYEEEVRKVMRKHLAGLAEIEQDRLGSLICRKAGDSDRPRIMLAGHMDEIGFMVSAISKEGFLRFQTLGGWWDQVMLAQRVVVKTHKGDVTGLIGSKPPHILSAEDRKKVVEKKDMFIDVGAASEEEARERFGVTPGDPVIPVSPFEVMANDRLLLGKAWDDRLGVALFIDVIKELAGRKHPNTVYGVGTVQEETGLRGATTSSHAVDPDVAIALEVDIAGDVPGVREHEAWAKLGKGPSILLYDASMIPNLKLRDLAISTAKENDIPVQLTALSGGSTDAGRMHIHGRGVAGLVVGVPTRYIHSHAGILHRDDYDNLVRLLVALVLKLDAATVAGLTG
jgi:putative aminopeptidase FrvX